MSKRQHAQTQKVHVDQYAAQARRSGAPKIVKPEPEDAPWAVDQESRQQSMAAPMPRQKSHTAPIERAQHQLVRRLAERRLDRYFLCIRKARHGVEPTAADNPDLCLLQIVLRARRTNAAYA